MKTWLRCRQLLPSGSLAEAKEVVLTSAARTEEAISQRHLVAETEHSLAIADAVCELRRPVTVAIDGPGDGPHRLADAVVVVVDDAVVVSADGFDWQRLRNEVLVPARAGHGITLVHGMFLLRPELAPYFNYRVYVTAPPATDAERTYLREVWPQSVASLVIDGDN